jgi:hypothetical protein
VTKYGFRIRTRHGGVVDNLLIYGRDEHEAVTKLRQFYHDCEVLETRRQVGGGSQFRCLARGRQSRNRSGTGLTCATRWRVGGLSRWLAIGRAGFLLACPYCLVSCRDFCLSFCAFPHSRLAE